MIKVEMSNQNLILYLKVNEGTGSVVADSSQYNNNGDNGGGIWSTFSNGEGALEFDGTSGGVVLVNNAAILNPSTFAIVADVVWDGTTGAQTIFHKSNYGLSQGVRFYVEDGGLTTELGNGSIMSYFGSGAVLTAGVRYTVAMWWDGSDVKFFVDGVQVGATLAFTGFVASSNNIGIGRNAGSTLEQFDGKIGEVRLYDVITAEEILNVSKHGYGMTRSITHYIDRTSFRIQNILTNQVDTCNFTMRYTGVSKTLIPLNGSEIKVYDAGEKVFAGNIVRIEKRSPQYKMLEIAVECADYGRKLDRFLINDSFENQTLSQILNFIMTDKELFEEGFTLDIEDGSRLITFIAFKYEPMSSVLIKLAELTGCDWYVDYDKVVKFITHSSEAAPFNIEDDDGSFIFESLRIRDDNSQVRNVIYVRGGEYLGNTFTTDYISDGTQNVYNLPYKYQDIQVSVTGSVWGGGEDGIDPPTLYDYIWNPEEKFIRFRGDRIPSNTSPIAVSGQPFLPVIVKMRDSGSIAALSAVEGGSGEYEYIIIDNTINSRQGARERALAEMETYAESLTEAEFQTYTFGLKAGQRINLNSSGFGVNADYVINRVTAKMWTHDKMVYQVSLVSTRSYGIVDFIRELILRDNAQIVVNYNDTLDVVESMDEEMFLTDTMVTASHNLQTETITLGETFTSQDLDAETHFVLGPWIPSDADVVSSDTGFDPVGTGANNAGAGSVAWTSPTNITSSDDSWAYAVVGPSGSPFSTTSQYLFATNFGFAIPTGATIDGIEVSIERFRFTTASGSVTDNTVSLLIAGTVSGDNKAGDAGGWNQGSSSVDSGGNEVEAVFGDSSDLWGLALTPADINNSSFGVALRVNLAASPASAPYGAVANVDHVKIKVYYTESTPNIKRVFILNGSRLA